MNTPATTLLVLTGLLAIGPFASADALADFEDLNLPADSFYNGSDNAGGFTSSGTFFNNTFTDFGGGWTGWTGWSYSNVNDTSTMGFGNQYAAYTGTDVSGSGIYAVGFADGAYFDLAVGETAQSVYVTNTTYAALSMLNGDGFAKQFGGTSGDDADYFTVTFTGYDTLGGSGGVTGSVEFYLADYRFADNSNDYIVDSWELVDLTALGEARSVGLSFASSDATSGWVNTPTYVALDNLATVPEPAAALLLSGLASLSLLRRRGA